MSDLHKIQITGRLGKEIERHDTEDFKESKSTIAVSNSFKTAEGQWNTVTTWYNLAFYNALAEKALKLTRGMKVFIDGKLSVKQYLKDGQEVTYQKIVVHDFFVCTDIKKDKDKVATVPNNFELDDDIQF